MNKEESASDAIDPAGGKGPKRAAGVTERALSEWIDLPGDKHGRSAQGGQGA